MRVSSEMIILHYLNFLSICYLIIFFYVLCTTLAESDDDDTTIYFIIKTPALATETTTETETTESTETYSTLSTSTENKLITTSSSTASETTKTEITDTTEEFTHTEDLAHLLPIIDIPTAKTEKKMEVGSGDGPKNYSGYSAIAIEPSSPEQLYEVLQFELKGLKYNFWSHRRILGVPLTLLVSTQDTELRTVLRERRIDYRILIEDVKKTFDEERRHIEAVNPSLIGISFNTYLKYDFIMDYLQHLSEKYSEITNLIPIGKTVEKRDITLIKIRNSHSPVKTIGTVLLEAGMHGREWLSVSLALYIINQLVEHAAANEDMFKGILWYVLPVLNPDGYEYAFTYDRLWKTNRAPFKSCHGVDLNRNFDVGQYLSSKPSTKKFMCTNLFAGVTAGSEPETKALTNFINTTNITVYISLHSGDTFIGQPWTHKTEKPIDYDTVQEMTLAIKEAIEEQDNSSTFATGRLSELCGTFDGSAIDWAKKQGVPYSLMLSLKGATREGFDVPTENIYNTVVAGFEGIRGISKYLQRLTSTNNTAILRNMEFTDNNSNVYQQLGLHFIFTILMMKVLL